MPAPAPAPAPGNRQGPGQLASRAPEAVDAAAAITAFLIVSGNKLTSITLTNEHLCVGGLARPECVGVRIDSLLAPLYLFEARYSGRVVSGLQMNVCAKAQTGLPG